MVRRLLQFVNQELSGIHQAAFLLAGASLFSKFLALYRDRLLASTFGAGRALDIYYVSFRLPDLLYTFSLFFAASTALIPIFLKKMSEEEGARIFISRILSLFIVLIFVIIAIAFVFTPYLAKFIAPGFNEIDTRDVILFTRILLLSPLLLGLSNIVSSVIQSTKRFFVFALSPVLYNAGIILGIIIFYPLWGFVGIIWGVIFGALLHLAIQLPSLLFLGFKPIFSLKLDKDVKEAIKLSLPRTLGISLNQIVLIAITAIASLLSAGSIAVFNLASNLQSVPLTVFALSYSIAAFPVLADSALGEKLGKFLKNFQSALRHIIFWSLPIMVLAIILRAQIVRVILGAGNFDWADTRLTAAAFALFALSILSQGMVVLFVRAFYAAQKTFLPVFINAASGAFIIASSFLFIWLYQSFGGFAWHFNNILRVGGVAGAKMLVLPLAYSLGSILNIFLLTIFFKKHFGAVAGKSFKTSLWQIVLSSGVMGFLAFVGLRIFDNFFELTTFVGVFLQGFFAGALAIVGGCLFLYFVGNKEFLEIIGALGRKFWRADVIVSEPEKMP